MLLIIGLGNPGPQFKNTPHNIGFEVLDFFIKKNNLPRWENKKRLRAKISRAKLKNKEIILAKPQTFMNSSGQATALLASFFRISPANIFVVHDDLYLPLGRIKISKGHGSAGHKGVQSVIDSLGTKEFIRLRIGVDVVENKTRKEDLVLKKFSRKQKQTIKQAKEIACKAIEETIIYSPEHAMSQFNRK